ncbi:MAG: hypothetical protein ACLSBH_12380 [Coprobacillus cateniformis]
MKHQKQRLKQLLEQQKQRIYNAKINEQKERILREIPQFHQHYQFADKDRYYKIKNVSKEFTHFNKCTFRYLSISYLACY